MELGLDGGAVGGVEDGIDAEEAALAGRVAPGVGGMDEREVFAEFFVKAGAAPAAEDHGGDIERGDVGMRGGGNVPGEMEARQLGGKLGVRLAAPELGGLRRDENGRQRNARMFRKNLRELRADGGGVDVADHDEEHVVRDVAGFVVGHDFVAAEGVEDVEVADDWMAIRMLAEGGGEERLAGDAVRVVVAHGELAADDLLLLDVFVGRERGVHHGVGEEVERGGDALRRDVDPVNGAVEGGVGIDVAAGGLDALGKLARAAGGRAFEKHVLEQMRDAGAEVAVLVDAAGFDPDLHARHGRAAVLLDDDAEAVRQRGGGGGDGGESERGSGICGRCGVEMHGKGGRANDWAHAQTPADR